MAHFNFVISQNAEWGHAGFYIDCHRMTVPENILLQKKHWYDLVIALLLLFLLLLLSSPNTHSVHIEIWQYIEHTQKSLKC